MFFENLLNWSILGEPEVLGPIISTFIGSVITAVPGLLTWLAGRSDREARQALKLEHLTRLYEPLDTLLSFKKRTTPPMLLIEAAELISKQYRYATPEIVQQIYALRDIKTLEFSDFSELENTVSAIHHWYRKKLGYTYNKSAINRKYLPKSMRRISLTFDIFSIIFLVLSLSLFVFALGYALLQLGVLFQSLASFFLSICFLIVVFKAVTQKT